MQTHPSGIIARYPDGDSAGRAIERLSGRGVEAGRISIVGSEDRPPMDRHTQRTTDAGTTSRIARRFGKGLVIGAVVGAVFGAIVVAIVTPAPLMVAVLAGGLAGAAAGAGLGALAGLESTPSMSTAWETTFAPDGPDGVVVAIEARDGASLDEVQAMLAGTGAIEVRRTNDLIAAQDHLSG